MNIEYGNKEMRSTSLTACSKARALRLARRSVDATPNGGMG
jgi:hypothetical protein